MNDYITLDGLKYHTKHPDWEPVIVKPGTVRVTLNSTVDVTYGPVALDTWKGEIKAPVVPQGAGWGSISDLRATLKKTASVGFTDHYGTAYSVHCVAPFRQRSFSPKWDGAENVWYVQVELVSE